MVEQTGIPVCNVDDIPSREISDPAVLSKTPLVSIKMITYNHEQYIAQAIEGVLLQETEFPIELVIGEDCSTDRTREIILEYQKQHPDVIRVITSEHNVGMKRNNWRTIGACRGAYMAFCEGDDYWTDRNKLQKQVEWLEANRDCSAVFHAAKACYGDQPGKTSAGRAMKPRSKRTFATKDVILDVAFNFITASLTFRSEHMRDLPEFYHKSLVGDFPLMLILSVRGSIGYSDELMCVHRVGTPASWTMDMRRGRTKRMEHYVNTLFVMNEFNSWTKRKYSLCIWFVKTRFIINRSRVELKSFIKSCTRMF